MPSDNPGTAYSANPSLYLFDNNNLYSGDEFGYHSGENAIPGYFIDLGTTTYLQRLDLVLDLHGVLTETPEIEIWSREDLLNAETGTNFESSGNNVISEPTSSELLEAAGWTIIYSSNLDGQNISYADLEINSVIKSRYIKLDM